MVKVKWIQHVRNTYKYKGLKPHGQVSCIAHLSPASLRGLSVFINQLKIKRMKKTIYEEIIFYF